MSEELKDVKPEQWKQINETLKTVKGFLDVQANDAFKSMAEGVVETARLKFQEVAAPITNELNALMNELLEPLLPMLSEIVQFVLPAIQWLADMIVDIRNFLMGGSDQFDDVMAYWDEVGRGGNIQDFIDWQRLRDARAAQAARRARNKRLPGGGLTKAQTLF